MEEKHFTPVRTQIGILKGRGMKIKNTRFAKRILLDTNYYNLINGYKTPFLTTTTREHYLPGTSFEELYYLSEFDRKLRILTLEYILKIEKSIKTKISYCFSNEYGHKDYLSYSNFECNSPKKFKHISRLLSSLYGKIYNNIDKEDSISHYVHGKNYIPLWVLVNTLSFGDISKFYTNMKQKEQNEVAKRFKYGIRPDELSSSLNFLSSIRNRCAHDELLYNYLSHVTVLDNNYFRYFRYQHINNKRNNYFSLMITFKRLLPKQDFANYYMELNELFDDLDHQIHTISTNKIRNIMGFPNNWRRLITLN